MSSPTEKVTGIGGIFFRVRDPVAMAAWYQQNLGIESKDGYVNIPWDTDNTTKESAYTVWSVFPDDTDYFGPNRPAFMINYRVANLERMVDQLRRNGVIVEKTEDCEYGRFAWVNDPEGNRIELWEPK